MRGERCLRFKLTVVREGFFDVIDEEELEALDPTDEEDAERIEALHEELRGELRFELAGRRVLASVLVDRRHDPFGAWRRLLRVGAGFHRSGFFPGTVYLIRLLGSP